MSRFEFAGISVSLFDGIEISLPGWVILGSGAVLLLLLAWLWLRGRRARSAALTYSDTRLATRVGRSGRAWARQFLPVLRLIAIGFLLVAFARPRAGTELRDVTSDGIDIMMLLDVSASMLAEDFEPHNRLHVAKEEIKDFVQQRISDRIGLIIFAGQSFTQCPLTVDYDVLLNFVDQVEFGLVEDGTAIGMAIANGVNRLRDSPAETKIMILLTDGDNNRGEIDPITAARLAEAEGIRVYTIGVGRSANAMIPRRDPVFGLRYSYQATEVDEETLKEIAATTDAKYFRARSGDELAAIYDEIDTLERTEVIISTSIEYEELFPRFAWIGLILLALELLLNGTFLRKLP